MLKGKSEKKHHTKAYIETSNMSELPAKRETREWSVARSCNLCLNYCRIFCSLIMAGAGDVGGEYHQLDGSQCLLLDVMTTQMQHLLNRNNEELCGRIEGLEHQMNQNAGRPYGGKRRGNDGPRQNKIEGQNRMEGVKLNVPSFKGRSDPDYTEEQKVKLATTEFSNYALVWWNKNQREMMREEGREIDTWTAMRKVMRKRYVPTSYNRTIR